jgi:hypothetical protein
VIFIGLLREGLEDQVKNKNLKNNFIIFFFYLI